MSNRFPILPPEQKKNGRFKFPFRFHFNKKYAAWAAAALLPLFAVSALSLRHAAKHDAAVRQHTVVQKLPPFQTGTPKAAASYWIDEAVQTGDDIAVVLRRLNLNEDSIQNLLKHSPADLNKLVLHEGQIISVRADSARNVVDVQFFRDDQGGERNLVALEKINGKWQFHNSTADTETMPSLRSAVITTSFTGAMSRVGVPVEIRTTLKEIFSEKLDIDKLKAGDSVRVLYESLYFRGQEVGTGNILAAEISSGGQTYHVYYLEHGDVGGSFYDEEGKPMKKGFDGRPLEYFTRISSPYGIRIHPVLGTVRMHTGIDYAAPTGTKVLAPSEGVVVFRGWKGGYGNTVMLQHENGLETLYGHLSAFVSGVEVGTRVSVGTVIALVGSTGRSTGPHLHYEVRINGQHVNPATVALPTPQLDAAELAGLKKYRAKADETIAAVRGLPAMVMQND